MTDVPELPEVEAARKMLELALVGHVISNVDVREDEIV
ncbi:MAG: hypothetical protein KF812_11380, partial [Fimbriimonadaceae bacterium]|nr:hypothetical protein [Fimbriimonadaceae bacterium]